MKKISLETLTINELNILQVFRIAINGDLNFFPPVLFTEMGGENVALTLEWDSQYSHNYQVSDLYYERKVQDFDAKIKRIQLDFENYEISARNILNKNKTEGHDESIQRNKTWQLMQSLDF